MKRVIIESPFAGKGDTPEAREKDRERNVEYALAAMADCLSRMEAPFLSHLLYTQVLDDNDTLQRALGIKAGLAWGEVADLTVVYQDRGISKGMEQGIAHAGDRGRNLVYRKVPGWVE